MEDIQGVSGCGKSTTGNALASALKLPFIEGDDLHPKHNVDKMSRGEPLTDVDREPWLKLIRKRCEEECNRMEEDGKGGEIESAGGSGRLKGVVVSCSALKRSYRDTLRGKDHPSDASHPEAPLKISAPPPHAIQTSFIFLDGPKELLEERMSSRHGHFMKRAMLESQLDTLEDPSKTGEEGVIKVDIRLETEKQVEESLRGLNLRTA